MLPPSPITALLYLPRADSASLTRCLLRWRSWPREGEITAMKNPALEAQEHWTPLLQTFEMQQVEVGGGGPQQQGPAFFYRDVIAISRLVASRPAGVPIPPATKLEGKLERKRPKEVQSSPLPTLEEASLPRARRRRCQRHAGYLPGGTPRRAKGCWRWGRSRPLETPVVIWGFAPCLVLVWVTRGLLQVWLREVCRIPGVCLSLPPEKQNCTLIPGNVIKIAWRVWN